MTVQEVRDLLVRCGLPGATVDSQLSRVWLDASGAVVVTGSAGEVWAWVHEQEAKR